MVVSCQKKFPLTHNKDYKFFRLRVDKLDLLISETNDNCENFFHPFECNVQIGDVILKIKKNGRFN